jgi:phage terminase large subunit GpA-like protein
MVGEAHPTRGGQSPPHGDGNVSVTLEQPRNRRAGAAPDRGPRCDSPAECHGGNVVELIEFGLERCRAPRRRTMRQFAEQDIVIPTGPFEARPFRCATLPWTGLWFDAVDSGQWPARWATGPSQSGKTLACDLIPLAYHLVEMRDAVVFGLPDIKMARDKWVRDLKPIFTASPKLAALLPTTGGGSRDGISDLIVLKNGATLKFMSAGGRDKSRAGYTGRVLLITEADGFDQPGLTSREADPIRQLRARLRAWGEQGIEFGECTRTTARGRTNQEITHGTDSRIVTPCPHCGAWVTPGRLDVRGWEAARDEEEAVELTRFHCPACQAGLTEPQRRAMNAEAVLLHDGQTIGTDGAIEGDGRTTRTLGFQWGAFHNLLRPTGSYGLDLWRARRAVDRDNAERELCQFVFGICYTEPTVEITPLTFEEVSHRSGALPRGVVPAAASCLTVHVDLHTDFGAWLAAAWAKESSGWVVAYGRFEIAGRRMALEAAIAAALQSFAAEMARGFAIEGRGGVRVPDQVWIDAGWPRSTNVVYEFCQRMATADRVGLGQSRYRPAFGRGAKTWNTTPYRRPEAGSKNLRYVGEQYHIKYDPARNVAFVEVDSDYWKTWVHSRLACPVQQPGALTLHAALPGEHDDLANELTAESKYLEYDVKTGIERTVWKRHERNNHYLDNLYSCAAAAHFCGARSVERPAAPARTVTAAAIRSRFRTPDGEPYVVTRVEE